MADRDAARSGGTHGRGSLKRRASSVGLRSFESKIFESGETKQSNGWSSRSSPECKPRGDEVRIESPDRFSLRRDRVPEVWVDVDGDLPRQLQGAVKGWIQGSADTTSPLSPITTTRSDALRDQDATPSSTVGPSNGREDISLDINETGLSEVIALDPYEHLRPPVGFQAPEQEDWVHVARNLRPGQILPGRDHTELDLEPPAELYGYKVPDPYAPEPEHEPGSELTLDATTPGTFSQPVWNALIEQCEPAPAPPEILSDHDPVDEAIQATTTDIVSEQPVQTRGPPIHEVSPPELSTRQDVLSAYGFAKLLRRLRRYMDDILNKRIQWQNEQQKVERRRAFYKASIKGMMEVIEAEHSSVEYRQAYQDGAQASGHVREQRGSLDVGPSQRGVRPTSGGTNSSRGQADSATSISFQSFGDARRQVKVDEHALNEQENLMKALVEQINTLEFHVQELVQEIVKQMGSAAFIDDLRMEMLDLEATTHNSEPRPEPEDYTPELVGKYFDWMGERGINLERLQELDHSHNDGLVQRDFLRDQGRELDVSDEEYLANYHSHREDIMVLLNEAREKIEYYWKQCEEAGLDPESYRRVASSVYSADMSHASRPVIQQFAEDDEGPARRSMSPPYEVSKLQIIEAWRRGIAPMQSDLVVGIASPTELPPNRPP